MGFRNPFKYDRSLSILEAKQRLYKELQDYTDWKLLKSNACLKKVMHEIVFEIQFYFSKYNTSQNYIGVYCEFLFWNKKLDKTCNIESKMGFIHFRPERDEWFDITTEKKLNNTIGLLKKQIDDFVLPFVKEFDNDYETSFKNLYSDVKRQTEYHLNAFKSYEKIRMQLGLDD